MEHLIPYEEWIEAFHIISVIMWMAGMLYLPRLFVYHAAAKVGSETDDLLQIMEKRLLRYILNPAMVCSLVFGLLLMLLTGVYSHVWFHVKFLAVLCMLVMHFMLAKHRKRFCTGSNVNSAMYFRILNETVTVLIIVIVIMVVVKPFS